MVHPGLFADRFHGQSTSMSGLPSRAFNHNWGFMNADGRLATLFGEKRRGALEPGQTSDERYESDRRLVRGKRGAL